MIRYHMMIHTTRYCDIGYGTMRYDTVWYAVWYYTIPYDTWHAVWYYTIPYDTIGHAASYYMIPYDTIWYRYDIFVQNVVWYNMILYDYFWYATIWYETWRPDIIWCDTMRYDSIRFDAVYLPWRCDVTSGNRLHAFHGTACACCKIYIARYIYIYR